MGCGCRKGNGLRNVGRRPNVTPNVQATTTGLGAAKTPTELKALSSTQNKNSNGMSAERRAIERRRRAEIALRTLGR